MEISYFLDFFDLYTFQPMAVLVSVGLVFSSYGALLYFQKKYKLTRGSLLKWMKVIQLSLENTETEYSGLTCTSTIKILHKDAFCFTDKI